MKECPVCHRCREDRHRLCTEDGAKLEIVFPGSPILDGKYHLLLRLGIGGMGRVYKARHLGLKRWVAVKIPLARRAGEQALAHFRREAEALGRLAHPNIVQVTDFGIEPDRQIPYLVLSYLEGTTLAARLRSGPLEPAEALPVFTQIAAALDHAHGAGILHRDLKPANVFLRETDPTDAPRVEVLDFGLSQCFADPETTLALTPAGDSETPTTPQPPAAGRDVIERPTDDVAEPLLGTPGYVAPEVLAGEAPTIAADLYAFGALIRNALSGHPKATSGNFESPLAPSIDAALATEAADRPTSAGQIVSSFRAALRDLEQARWRRRETPRRLALGLALGLMAAILAAALEKPLEPFEHRLIDARFALAPLRTPSHHLILVKIDDATLATDSRPLDEKADEVGTLLRQVLEAGAAGVGIDLLLPAHWGRSKAFVDLILQHSEAIVLAAFSPPSGPVVGPEVVTGLIAAGLGPERTERLFGYVNLDQERDGVVRRARLQFRDVDGIDRPAFATRWHQLLADNTPQPDAQARHRNERLWIDFTLDWRRLEQISWRDLPRVLSEQPDIFRNRLVLLGATYTASGDGSYPVPHRPELPGTMAGPFLQSLIAATLLGDSPLQPAARPWWLAAAGWLVAGFSTWILLARRTTAALMVCLAVALGTGWSAAALVLLLRYHLLVNIAPFVGALATTTVVAIWIRKRLNRISGPQPLSEISEVDEFGWTSAGRRDGWRHFS